MTGKKIFLSPPHMSGLEMKYIQEAFDSNYIAPVGSQIDSLEIEFSQKINIENTAAVSSGTAALHLALRYAGVKPGDEVVCSTFTFIASANAILYLGATPVFIDSDFCTWNMDPGLLEEGIKNRAAKNRLPKAVIVVHIYGQMADIAPIKDICDRYGIALIEDAAEALGSTYMGHSAGTFGLAGIFSFNGNKIITGSSGGMIVSRDKELINKIKFWATQAKDDAPHYQHTEMGYNYRMSNIVAAIARAQLKILGERVKKKRKIYSEYKKILGDLEAISFMPEAQYGCSNQWLTCVTVDKNRQKVTRDIIRKTLERNQVESRPLWKPMHLQPIFRRTECWGGTVSEELFRDGLCLPSGTSMAMQDIGKIGKIIRGCWDK